MATSPTPPRPIPIAASAIETLLLREKLVTPDQIAHAMTVQVATGKSIEEVVRENGWVSDADLARLLQHVNPHAEPRPAVVEQPEAPQVVELPVVAPFPTVVPDPVQEAGAPEPQPVHPVVAPELAPQVIVPQPEPVVPQVVVPEPVVPQVVVPEPVQQVAVEPEPAPQVVVPQPVHTVPVPEPVQPVAAPEPVQPEPVHAPAAVQPVAAPAPAEPVVSAPEPVQPVASPALQVHVTLRLTNGERIQMASFEDKDTARQFALELSRELALSADWPFLGGRFIRPEAVVSIDIDLTAF